MNTVMELFWCTLIVVVPVGLANLWEAYEKRKEDESLAKFEAKHGSCSSYRKAVDEILFGKDD